MSKRAWLEYVCMCMHIYINVYIICNIYIYTYLSEYMYLQFYIEFMMKNQGKSLYVFVQV